MTAGFTTGIGFTPGEWNCSRVSLHNLNFVFIAF